MTNPSSAFIAEKNKQTNAPIWLFQLWKSDNVAADYAVAMYPTEIVFKGITFRATGGIRHNGLGENGEGKVEKPTVDIPNLDRAFEYDFQDSNRFKGCKVVIWQVFANLLNDTSAYLESIWYIDKAVSNEEAISFTLSSRADIIGLEVPSCRYSRDFCRFQYKGDGCWKYVNGVLTPDSGFTYDTSIINSQSTSKGTTDYGSAEAHEYLAFMPRVFLPVNCAGLSNEAGEGDYIEVDITVDGELKAGHYYNNIFIVSSSPNTEYYWHNAWKFSINPAQITPNVLTTLRFNCADAEVTDVFDVSSIRKVYAVLETKNEGTNITIGKIVAYRGRPWSFSRTNLDSCDHSLRDCKRHNNQERFGGQPSIPIQRVIRV